MSKRTWVYTSSGKAEIVEREEFSQPPHLPYPKRDEGLSRLFGMPVYIDESLPEAAWYLSYERPPTVPDSWRGG